MAAVIVAFITAFRSSPDPGSDDGGLDDDYPGRTGGGVTRTTPAGLLVKLQDDHPVDRMICMDFHGFGSIGGSELG